MSNQRIIVRSLRVSDLGWFSAQRDQLAGRQRAININAVIVREILTPELFSAGGGSFNVQCDWLEIHTTDVRRLYKDHKNWRLAGKKVEGGEFGMLDACDFLLIKTVVPNDSSHTLYISFVSKKMQKPEHSWLAEKVKDCLSSSMAMFSAASSLYSRLDEYFPEDCRDKHELVEALKVGEGPRKKYPLIPRNAQSPRNDDGIKRKMRSPQFLETMFKVAGDLSAKAQFAFLENLEGHAIFLRECMLRSGMIRGLQKDHSSLWRSVVGSEIGFVDGGMASLSTLGAAPIAARVGTYVVRPGDRTQEREEFCFEKYLVDELYESSGQAVFAGAFPDTGALRDAARISIEASGVVSLLRRKPSLRWAFMHGALVNPVSRYTDVIEDGVVAFPFPNFSQKGIEILLPGVADEVYGDVANFINVYLRQLEELSSSNTTVCGVVERESQATSVFRTVLDRIDPFDTQSILPIPFEQWRHQFIGDAEDFRFVDSLIFRCVLEPGEITVPVPIDRNELRRAPNRWKDVIAKYPRPFVSYLQVSEWSAPFRLEWFEKDVADFETAAKLMYHSALLLPYYAFPAGLDIADKFAKVPNWMSVPVSTHTVVQALRRALEANDDHLFDNVRRLLCGTTRDWLFRPKA